jgi:hypothetical protein
MVQLSLTAIIIILVGAVLFGTLLGYGVSEGFSDGIGRYRCKEYIDMSKYVLKTEVPPIPDMSEYIKKAEIPKCPPCVCGCSKPCRIGKCPPCPRPRCPEPRTATCAPCPACPTPQPVTCPQSDIIVREVSRQGAGYSGAKPALSPLTGIFGNFR